MRTDPPCVVEEALEAPPCINCGRPLEGSTYTGDCLTACDEDCYEQAWLKQPIRDREEPTLDLTGAIFVGAGKTIAVFSSRDALPAWMLDSKPGRGPRFIFFTAAGDVASWSEIEVTARGLGLVTDQDRGGVLVIAPRVIDSGDTFEEECMVYDRERRDWFESCDIVDNEGRVLGWKQNEVEES
jgi:hypothetical protein